MPRTVENYLSFALTIAALGIASGTVKREFFPPVGNTPGGSGVSAEPAFYPAWRELAAAGHTSGNAAAPVQVVIFSDFECPACRAFDRGTLADTRAEFGESLAVTLLHFPLPIHRFAPAAAIASECAADQGRFEEYANTLYAFQDSLGLKSWWSMALLAGVGDSIAFQGCLSNPAAAELVAAGMRLGKELAIRGTPTVIVNGWQFPTPPSIEMIRKVAARKVED